MSIGRSARYCQYVTGWDNGPKLCGSRTQNLVEKVPICVYHAQFTEGGDHARPE